MAQRFRDHDWGASAVGPPEDWGESLRTLVGVMLNASQPMFIVWGPERSTLYNDAYAEILADKHPALGEPFDQVWHEIWEHELEPAVTRAYAGEALHMEDVQLTMMRKGYPEETHFAFSYTPVRGSGGTVEGFFCPCLEITEQVLEQRRVELRSTITKRLRGMKEPEEIRAMAAALIGAHLHVDEVLYARLDSDHGHAVLEPAWTAAGELAPPSNFRLRDIGGALAAELIQGRSLFTPDAQSDPRLAAPVPRKRIRRAGVRAALIVPLRRDERIYAALLLLGREPRIWHASDVSLVEEMAARIAEACQRTRLERRRRTDEARLRETSESLALATAASELGSGTWDFAARTINLDERGRRILGLSPAEDRVSHWIARIHPDDRQRLHEELRSCRAEGRPFDLRYRVVHPDQTVRHIHGTGMMESDDRGEPLFATGFMRDVTEIVEAEQHQNLLIAELDHRVKNILALVQSIAQMSLRTGNGSLAAGSETFLGRIRALAHSHALLARGRWKGAALRDLIATVAQPYQGLQSDRIAMVGEHLHIGPKAAQTLALTIHELFANAAKHGALSSPGGTITIAWETPADGAERRLVLSWQERGGPDATAVPQSRGFGLLMIEGSLAYELQGKVQMDFTPAGLSATFALPIEKLTAYGASAFEPAFA